MDLPSASRQEIETSATPPLGDLEGLGDIRQADFTLYPSSDEEELPATEQLFYSRYHDPRPADPPFEDLFKAEDGE